MNKKNIFNIYRFLFILHYLNKISSRQIIGGKKLTIEYNRICYLYGLSIMILIGYNII